MAKILIVEPDRATSDGYQSLLVAEGHKVVRSFDGQDGLTKTRNEKFDLIITELKMEKLNGQKLVTQLEFDDYTSTCPVLIVSSEIEESTVSKFGSNKRVHLISKPVAPEALLTRIKSLVGSGPQPKAKIDVRFINPVLDSTIEVLESMTQYSIQASKPYVKPTEEISGDISDVVGVVSSGFKGTISLSFSEAGFIKVISKMLQEEIQTINDENKDAVAELLNIIFGKAKKILNASGLNIQQAIPSIIRGPGHSIQHQAQNQTIVIPFTCPEIGNFRAEVSSTV